MGLGLCPHPRTKDLGSVIGQQTPDRWDEVSASWFPWNGLLKFVLYDFKSDAKSLLTNCRTEYKEPLRTRLLPLSVLILGIYYVLYKKCSLPLFRGLIFYHRHLQR